MLVHNIVSRHCIANKKIRKSTSTVPRNQVNTAGSEKESSQNRAGSVSEGKAPSEQNYASTFNNTFPPSASLTKAADGNTDRWRLGLPGPVAAVHAVRCLYKVLPSNGDPEDASNPAIVAAMNTQFGEFLCPSGPRRRVTGAQQSAGITNYKAMGATTRGSLVMVVNPQATPPYGTMSSIPGTVLLHPDGAIFPSTTAYPFPAFWTAFRIRSSRSKR